MACAAPHGVQAALEESNLPADCPLPLGDGMAVEDMTLAAAQVLCHLMGAVLLAVLSHALREFPAPAPDNPHPIAILPAGGEEPAHVGPDVRLAPPPPVPSPPRQPSPPPPPTPPGAASPEDSPAPSEAGNSGLIDLTGDSSEE